MSFKLAEFTESNQDESTLFFSFFFLLKKISQTTGSQPGGSMVIQN